MATIRQIKVKDVVYDISPSPSGTLDTTTKDNAFASSDVAQASATTWTDVAALAATETNKSMFTKATQMMKNTRYLYNIIGTGFSTSSTIRKAIDSKAASNHSHDLSTMINGLSVGTATPQDADYYVCQYAGGGNTTSTYHRRPMSALWDYIKTKGNSVWQPKGSYASSTHTHNYAGSRSAGGSANSAVKLDTATAGSASQPVYFKDGKPVAIGYTIATSVPANAKFTDTNTTYTVFKGATSSAAGGPGLVPGPAAGNEGKFLQGNGSWGTPANTWRGIQDNLTSTSTSDSLSANQGKVLKGLVDGKAPASHTHTKSQITDFPSSLKNPTALTVQGNGTTLATYDGSAAKTVNITKSSVGLSNVDNTADSAKTVAKANQLTTTRTVSGGTDIPLSFTYNGSANSSASIGYYSCTATGGNTSNYPWHRIAKLDVQAGACIDQSITLYITQGYQDGGFGIIRITLRTNNSNSTSTVEARWLVRSGFSADQVQVGLYNVYAKTYADVFLKIGGYGGTTIRAIGSDARGSIKRTWVLVNSTEAQDTTASDKKTSTECWASIASAATALHKQAYTNTVAGSDKGTVSYANSAGSCSSATTASKIGTGTVGSSTKPVYINGGTPTACNYSLGNACSKSVRTLTAQGPSGWKDATTDQGYVPDMAFMAYWNGAYSGSSSNLVYCCKGAFGTAATKNIGDFAAASHSHKYAGSGSAGGSANSAVKLDTATAGSTTQPVYFSGGKPVAIGYTIAKSVPADAKFTDTNTWRGIQNNLTSTATDQSLSAAQGKALKDALDKKTGVSVSGNTLVFA